MRYLQNRKGNFYQVFTSFHVSGLRFTAQLLAHGLALVTDAVLGPNVAPVYTYNCAVADDYTGSQFNAGKKRDGYSNPTESYQVALPR